MNIMLIGFKNSGKTTIGKKLASFLNKKFFDIDEIIEELFYKKYEKNLKVSLIFNFLKKQKFKEIETEAILSLKNIKNAVIATSGSFILNEDNFNILKNLTKIFYLKVSKEILKKRVQEDKENTIFKNDKFFEKEYGKRKDLYSKKAFFTLQADDINFDEILRIIKGKINE